jgi:predicted enzyme related to lactoylglutathione lyase
MAEHGTFYWNELMTRDAEAAKRFYAETIGWSFDGMPMPDGTYWIVKMGDKPVGGLIDVSKMPGNMQEAWMPYLAVDDIDARLEKARAAGATVIREPFDIEGVGRIAILQQPGGGMVGWMTPAGA